MCLPIPDLIGLAHLSTRRGKSVCITCGVALPGTNLVAPRCDRCNAEKMRLSRERIAAGLCPRCHNTLLPGYRACARHVNPTSNKVRPVKWTVQLRWDFDRLYAEHGRITTDAGKLINELWSMDGDEDTTLEFVIEAEEERDAKLVDLLDTAGWTREEFKAAMSDTIVLGDGRVVKKAPGVMVRRVG